MILGRKNYEGFGSYWPNVATDDSAEPRDRAFAQWFDEVEKIAFSNSLTEPTWQNSRIVSGDPAEVIDELRTQDGGDIMISASASVIRALLEADQVDRLSINLCPEVSGGGMRLFEDGIPASSWTLAGTSTSESGAIWAYYDRKRS